jgi:chorismate mutase
MEIAAQIAAYKKKHNMAVYHPDREREVLDRVTSMSDSEMEQYIESLYATLFELSKKYQTERNES